MRLAELRPGWHTDFVLHRFGAEVLEREDCLVVRTPANPSFYWGNCLLLPQAPRDEDLALWLARFDAEIAQRQPLSRHVAIGVDAAYGGQPLPAWRAAGFHVQRTTMLCLHPGGLQPPARPARGGVTVRPLDLATEHDAVIEVEATDAGGFEPAGYRAYLRLQGQRYRAMQAAGLLHWFGLWCDGTLAASCGLLRDAAAPGASARFQRVVTHDAWRRRGLCTALVHAVTRHAFEQWRAAAVYMAADPDDVAIGIYRTLGYRDLSAAFGLQRNAPQDRGA
jgi:ribosomal protein S18 acetylase RimI-like enzyme